MVFVACKKEDVPMDLMISGIAAITIAVVTVTMVIMMGLIYKIKFEMEMGVISNQTHLYNEMVYSTGFHHRLAMKTIKV